MRLPDASARTRAAYRARSASSRRSRHWPLVPRLKAGGVPERLQVLYSAPQRRPGLRRRRLVVGPLPEAVPLAVGARPRWPQWSELDTVDRGRPFALAEERADVGVVDMVVHRQPHVARVPPDADVGDR